MANALSVLSYVCSKGKISCGMLSISRGISLTGELICRLIRANAERSGADRAEQGELAEQVL